VTSENDKMDEKEKKSTLTFFVNGKREKAQLINLQESHDVEQQVSHNVNQTFIT
jgi:hypothetical protein